MIQNKYKILIVEDEANIRNLIATMLETEGYYTMFADTVSAAKTLFKSHRPEVVILDLGLPDMDGMNFIDLLAQIPLLLLLFYRLALMKVIKF